MIDLHFNKLFRRICCILIFFSVSIYSHAQQIDYSDLVPYQEAIVDRIDVDALRSQAGLSKEDYAKVKCQIDLIVLKAAYNRYKKAKTPGLSEAQTNTLELSILHIIEDYNLGEAHDHDYAFMDSIAYIPERIPRELQKDTTGFQVKSTTCVNADFESNNFNGWSAGFASNGGEGNINPGFDTDAMNSITGNHTMMGPGAGMDGPSNNNLPRVFPGGGDYSLRLGNQQTGYQAARISYSFTVTANTELFLYHFAAVMQDPGHSASEQPFLRINLIIDGVSIPCGEYFQAASGSAPGYLDGSGSVKYKPWETVSIALSTYMGQNATIEFTTSDCSQSGHYGYAYIDAQCIPFPSLSNDTLTCQQTEVTLEGPPGASEYLWTGPGIVGADDTKDIIVNQGGVYDVQVIPVQGPQCSYTLQTEVIDQIGNVDADFLAVPDEVCHGESISFQDESILTPNAGTITDYYWSFDDGTVLNTSDPDHNYVNPGTYDVTYGVYTSGECTDTITKTVVVHPMPEADYSVDNVCLGEQSEFVNNSSVDPINGNIIDSYEWTFGDGSSSSDQNPTTTYNNENIFNTQLIVTTNNGCKDTLTQTATVWPLPDVDFSPTDVCLEFDTEFFDESSISNANTNNSLVDWQWDFGDGSTSAQQNPIHSYVNDGTYNTNLEVTSNNGCINDTTLVVTVHPKPEASFTGVNLTGCAPICPEVTSTSLVNQPSNIVDYEWRLSDGTVVQGSNSTYSECFENETGNSIFYGLELEVTTDMGCKDTHTEANYIGVYHNPIASFYASPDNPDIIDPQVDFTNTSYYADTYDWTFFGVGTSVAVNPSIDFPIVPDTYQVEMVASTDEGCTDTAWIAIEILDRIIFYVPNTFTPDKDDFNEVFKPIFTAGYDPNDFTLLIFNRWGEIVFESHDANVGWDGTYGAQSNRIVKDGTYVWKIVFKETMSDKNHTHTGHVNVLK
jgi:gliding motility-associated-like protein